MLLKVYTLITYLLYPFWGMWLLGRAARGKENRQRLRERFGYAGMARPEGKLLWLHAASVGEVASILSLIHAIQKQYPHWRILVTTGTINSARLLAERAPTVTHQFLPMDSVPAVKRFLLHWQPDLVLWVESEFWPVCLTTLARHGVPVFLINARLSETSYRRWQRLRGLAQPVLSSFTAIYAQTKTYAKRLQRLGAVSVDVAGNLKADAEPLPYTPAALAAVQATIGARPVWLAASLHPDEDAVIINAAATLQSFMPELLTILAPRHPERGRDMAARLGKAPEVVCRSQGALPMPQESFYIADTLGELGLWYALCRIVFVGGSLIPHGGQNILEPALFHCAILHGEHMHNFPDMMAAFQAHNATITVADAADLAETVKALLMAPDKIAQFADAATTAAHTLQGAKTTLMTALQPYFTRETS